jgi:hypothetical protein
MSKHERIPDKPPAPRAAAVTEHLQASRRTLAALEAQVPEMALAAALGEPGGAENLTALHQKIGAVKFEIECYPRARARAERSDEQAVVDWRAQVQTLPPEQIVDGIGREVCPRLCGAGGGCVIAGSDPLAGGLCCHPNKEGLVLSRYNENPQIVRVFAAACAALKIRSVA